MRRRKRGRKRERFNVGRVLDLTDPPPCLDIFGRQDDLSLFAAPAPTPSSTNPPAAPAPASSAAAATAAPATSSAAANDHCAAARARESAHRRSDGPHGVAAQVEIESKV